MVRYALATILLGACVGGAERPDATVPDDGSLADSPFDNEDSPPGAESPDATQDSIPPSATGNWIRVVDALGSSPMALATDQNGAVLVAQVIRGPARWGRIWLDQPPDDRGTVVAMITPDGAPGWALLYPGRDQPPSLDTHGGRVFLGLGRQTTTDLVAGLIIALDDQGRELWRRERSLYAYGMAKVRAMPAGGVILHGTRFWTDGTRWNTSAPMLEELDADGASIRVWSYDPDATNPPAYTFGRDFTVPRDVLPLGDGSLAVGGQGVSVYDNGTLRWRQSFNSLLGHLAVVDGDLLVNALHSPSGPPFGADGVYVARLDGATGGLAWSRRLPSWPNAEYAGLSADPARHLVWVGGTFKGTVELDGQTFGSDGAGDIWFTAFDELGASVAATSMGTPGADRLLSIAPLPDGGLVASGIGADDPLSLFELTADLADPLGLAGPGAPRTFITRITGSRLAPLAKRLCELDPVDLWPASPWLHLVTDLSRGLDGAGPDGVPLRTLVGGGLAAFFGTLFDPKLTQASLSWATSPDIAAGSGARDPICGRAVDGHEGTTGIFDPFFMLGSGLSPGLSGVLAGQADWLRRRTANPGPIEPVLVVVAPSLEPIAGCGRTSDELAAMATNAAARRPHVRTHVVAIGPRSEELDALAAAGGTSRSVVVDSESDVAAGVSAALRSIRLDYRCDFGIESRALTLARTPPEDLLVTLDGESVPRVVSCGANGTGWVALDAEHPRWLRFCPATCDAAYAALLQGRNSVKVGARERCLP